MEAKIRPLPITLTDFLGILLPGFLWCHTGATIYLTIKEGRAISPVHSMDAMMSYLQIGGLGVAFALISIALVIGYGLNAIGMSPVEYMASPLRIIPRNSSRKESRGRFPFENHFSGQSSFLRAKSALIRVTDEPFALSLTARQTFSAVKRYLKMLSPDLWEESERIEAQVRMVGSSFMVTAFSVASSAVIAATYSVRYLCWVVLYLAVSLVLGVGFNALRWKEVEYTYLNFVLAIAFRVDHDEIA